MLGLAPSAAAAVQLRDSIGSPTDTLAKLTWSIDQGDLPDWASSVGWVKNGDRWTVLHVGQDGALKVRHTQSGRTVTLPAGYVGTASELRSRSPRRSADDHQTRS